VIDRPNEFKFDGLTVSRGLFAPTIRFHDGLFYVINTAVDAGGNFFVTAKNPAGPWSEPHWLPEIDGIDPSFFFDDDGKAYVVNNGVPIGNPLYEGHRAIWIQEFDVAAQKLVGPRKMLVNGGTDITKKPVWIEGPHLFKHNGWYYLICAEGGTSEDHSEVVFRSRSPLGPFVSFQKNPILTQRDLPAARPNPITSTGHADFVEGPDGGWWATFLGCRPYRDNHYNTGRETFMLPVKWEDDWPIILAQGQPVPYEENGPRLPANRVRELAHERRASADALNNFPLSGNFDYRDDFNQTSLAFDWVALRDWKTDWVDLKSRPGYLVIHPLAAALSGREQPSFLARRQQHSHFSANAALLAPGTQAVSGGVVAFQNETHYFYFGLRESRDGYELFVEQANNAAPAIVARRRVSVHDGDTVQLKIEGAGADYSFVYQIRSAGWQTLVHNMDGTILSTSSAGGFVGAMVGPYARIEQTIQDLPSKF
jgi:alpha-N-arabinofuranosidase